MSLRPTEKAHLATASAVVARSIASAASTHHLPAIALDPKWLEIDGDLLDEKRASVPAFPLDLLPPPWREWAADAARAADTSVDYVAQAVLAAAAGMSGVRVGVRLTASWVEPLLLWLAAVGAPSTGKSPALKTVLRLLARLEDEAADGAGGPRRRVLLRARTLADIGAALERNRQGMLLLRDDAAGCLAPPGGARNARQLEDLAVSILGSIEPDRAAEALQGDAAALAARFVYAWPAPPPFRPLAERQPPRNDAALTMLRRLLRSVGTLEQPYVLWIDEPAEAAFNAFLARLHGEIRQAEGLEAAWLGKGRGTVARLAGVLTLLRWSASDAAEPPPCVDGESMEQAVSLWSDYYRPHALAFFRQIAPTDLECQARRVVRWLRADGRSSVSRKDVRRTALGQTVTARDADRVLARLAEAGVLRPLTCEKRPQGGRPALRWWVNPALAKS